MISVPYCAQEKEYWCGPASLQMVLSFFGITSTQADLAAALATTEEEGTKEEMFEKVVVRYGLRTVEPPKDFDSLVAMVRGGLPVIVGYLEPIQNEGHFSVAVDACAEELLLLDPELESDPHVRISKEDFLKRWKGKYAGKEGWSFVCELSSKR